MSEPNTLGTSQKHTVKTMVIFIRKDTEVGRKTSVLLVLGSNWVRFGHSLTYANFNATEL